ncbi:hypothetical protein D0Z03_002663 [Geotrichum reessii]|nr:hypothetical protein D0Z03_002663 [Galactomyces reessii]
MASYTAFASYYDSLGVLSICDALDSLDGIPASALLLNPYLNSSTKGIDILAGPYPPHDYEQLHLQYQQEQEQEQQQQQNQEQQQTLEQTNLTTTTTSNTNSTNEHNSTDEGLPINGTDVYPMYYARPLQHSEQDLLASNIATASVSLPTSGISTNSAQSVIATNNTNTAFPTSIGAAATSSRTSISIPSSTTLPIVNGVEASVIAAAAAAVTRKREPKRAHERANSRNPSSSHNGLGDALSGASVANAGRVSKDRDANGYKIEECPVCGRAFKGPKASTHRQQHIRRLHPQDYIPKRGGKKRVVVE